MKTLLVNFSESIPNLSKRIKFDLYYQIGVLNIDPIGKISVNNQKRLNQIAEIELKKYSNWIYKINKLFLKKNLILNKNLSLFFLTDLSNKRSELFDTFNNVCNILLIKEIVKEKKISRIILNEAEESFIQSINSLLKIKTTIIKKRKNIKLIKYNLLTIICKHLNLLLKYFIYRLLLHPIIRKSLNKNYKCNKIFFTRYPLHFLRDTNIEEKYRYLVGKKDKYITNLNADGLHQSLGILKCFKSRLKIKNENPRQHIVIDDYINLKNIGKSFFDIFKFYKPFFILSNKKYIYKGIDISLSIKSEYGLSMQRLLGLLLCHRGLDNLLKKISANKYIFYLNEYAFGRMISYTLHKNNIINTVGMQHGFASRRRLCLCLSSNETPNNFSNYLNSVPLPKQFLVENKNAKSIYEDFGHNNCKVMKKIPRLAYLKDIRKSKVGKKIYIIAGLHDFEMLIQFMKKIVNEQKKEIFYLKTHPRSMVNLNKYKFPNNLKITNRNITELLLDAKLIYVSYSSVGLEARDLNIPVIQIEYPGKINELGIND